MAVTAVLVGVVFFVGLTRTEVGRDQIRQQIEAQFNQQFQGTLSIDSLSGSLLTNLEASGVQLRSPSGTLVGTVDGIRATPQWANLLTAELSVQSLTLSRPHLTLHRDSAGTWNAARALRQKSSSSNSPLDLTFADIEVQQGRVTTSRNGPAPDLVQQGWLFDYTRTNITGLSFSAVAQRTGTRRFVELDNASFSMPGEGLRASFIEGQVEQTADGWSARDLDVSLDTTRIRGEAALQTNGTDRNAPQISVRLKRSRIDHGEIRRLVPRLPLADVVTLEGTFGATPQRLSVDDMTITHNTSIATLNGTLRRQSSNDGLAMDLRLTEGRFAPRDVRDVWPSAPRLPPVDEGPFGLTASVQGTTAAAQAGPRTFDLATRLAMESPHGAVRGSLDVARTSPSGLTYSVSLNADSLNLAPLTGRPALASRLSGQVEGNGSGTELGTLQGSVDVSLTGSQIAGRPFASADGTLTIDGDSSNGTLSVRQKDGGRLYVNGTAQNVDRRPRYTASVSGTGLDLKPLLGPTAPATQLNARLTIGAAGLQWRSLTGRAVLRVDSSRVNRGDRTVALPPHSATLRLAARTADRPRVQLSGSVLRLTADGTSLGPPLWRAAQTWGTELRKAVRRERNKPAPSQERSSVQPSLYLPADAALRASLQSQSPLQAQARMRVLQPKIVSAWWPTFPEETENLTVETQLSVGPDSLHTAGRVSADFVRSGPNSATGLRAEYDVSSHIDAPLAQSTLATGTVSAEEAALGGPALKNATVSLAYGGRTGRLQARADTVGIANSVRLSGGLRITPRANELRLQTVSATIHGNEWTNASSASLQAYSDALVVTPFTVQQPHPDTPALQEIRIGGTVSARPTDTLAVRARNVSLPPFSRALGLPQLIGGNLDGEVRLRSALNQPELTSDVAVHRLSFDRRVLGTAQLRLAYAAQSPDLRVKGQLRSEAQNVNQLTGPDLVPSGARTVEPNNISVSGRVRLPEWARVGSLERASALPPEETLDLSVKVERADLFFFRYIFEERVAGVRGFVSGPLHIGGRVQDPRFEADFEIVNGAVRLPVFGLAYELEGPVEVDKRGIHARTLRVQDDEGTATVNGSILFNDYQYFSFDLSASLDGITVIDVSQAEDLPFYGHIRGSGPLHLNGPLPDATLESNSARTTPDSELYIPVSGRTVEEDTGYIVFTDSTGQTPSVSQLSRRPNILADRPEGVPSFVEGLNLNLNVIAPNESTVNLVFDPLVGDVVTVVGSGRVQLQREEGDFSVYGSFDATSGTYLFTAGEVFVRRFSINQGTITWDGSSTNAQLDLDAEYRTRASPSGLPGFDGYSGRIPVTVQLAITGRVASPQVDLSLSMTRSEERNLIGSETLDAALNQPARTTEYATSVLLTNTFLLTTESITQSGTAQSSGESNQLTTAGNQLAFNSVSQLVSSQLNRYLGAAFPNVDLNLGVQGEDPSNLDLIYGVALRLLNERLIIRGEGVYTNDDPAESEAQRTGGPQGEFVVEVQLSPSVSAKVFYRRTGDELTPSRALTSSRGAGVSYQTQFPTWRRLLHSIFGWMLPTDSPPDDEAEPAPDPVARSPVLPSDSTASPEAQEPSAQNEPV